MKITCQCGCLLFDGEAPKFKAVGCPKCGRIKCMESNKPTPGPWEVIIVGTNCADVRNNRGAEVCQKVWEPNAYLIAAAPEMLSEIDLTRKRLSELMKKLSGKVDNDTMTDLATMEMDLNRVAAIADGSWPGLRKP